MAPDDRRVVRVGDTPALTGCPFVRDGLKADSFLFGILSGIAHGFNRATASTRASHQLLP
jgi:hypothetical protein